MRLKLYAGRIAFCTALVFSPIPNLWASAPIALTVTNFTHSGGTSVISWTAETNSFTNVFFNVQRTTNLDSNFTELMDVSENSALVYTDSVSVNGTALYRIAESNAFTTLNQPGAFTAYDAGNTAGLNTIGYSGAVFDGRYIYFVPYYNTSYSGIVLRFDTTSNFTSSVSWSAYDAGSTSGLKLQKGFFGGVFDGRYVYFVPNNNGTSYNGTVLRFDTTSNFTSSVSWLAYDAGTTSGLNAKGFAGGVFDGRYIYFVPNYNGTSYSGTVLRFDTTSNFTSSVSWSAYDAGSTSGLNAKGFFGGVFDGRYIYFVPYYNGTSYSGTVLRFDTTSNFTSSVSWSAYDASGTSGLNPKGFFGGVSDGRYIYFVPYYNGTSYNGTVLRFDTTSNFTSSVSWSAYDAGSTSGLNTKGFFGGAFDGRYIYFDPNNNGTSYSGTVLRFDTTSNFTSSASWSAYDAGSTSGLNTTGYGGAVSDGRYIYFAPYANGGGSSGNVLRFDAKLPRAVPATVSGGSNF